MSFQHKLPKGSSIEDGAAHEEHHNEGIGRRDFLKNLGLVSAGTVAFSGIPFNQLLASPVIAKMLSSGGDRVLVVIRLKGGNDGLNTFVPVFDYGSYETFRPILKIPTPDLLPLNNKYSVPNYAASLKNLWDSGKMKVVQNVGYSNQDLSHFASTDIWDSADNTLASKSGWLGRYLWNENPNFLTNPPIAPLAVQVGGDGNILFFNENSNNMAMNVVDPANLYQIAQTGSLYNINGNATCYYEDQLDFMKSIINSTYYQSESIHNAYNAGNNTVAYPTGLGESLSLVARLIKGELATKIYMLTLDGFDTHALQDERHPQLLTQLADSVKAFYDDLASNGKDQNVLTMTFSEFGRTIWDNGSKGTDHGAAAPLMLFGPALNGNGFVGDDISFTDLDQSYNMKHKIDFRQVYTSVLQDWMCANELTADTIMGGSYSKIPLGFDCLSVGNKKLEKVEKYHQLRYDPSNTAFVFLNLPESANVKFEAYDFMGRSVSSTNAEYFSQGLHTLQIPNYNNLASGTYLYRIYINGNLETGKMQKY